MASDSAGNDSYWATKKGADLISELDGKERAFFDAIENRGFLNMWRIAYAQHFGQDPNNIGSFETQQVSTEGEAGEYVLFRINETRSFVKQQVTLATGDRPAFQCMALNTDYDSTAQIDICDAMVTYFYEAQEGEAREREVVESDSVFGAGFGWIRWDDTAGEDTVLGQEPEMREVIDQETGEPVMETQYDEESGEELYDEESGDPLSEAQMEEVIDEETGEPVIKDVIGPSGQPVVDTLYPWEMVQETKVSKSGHMWRTAREQTSRWELVADYPEHADAIKGLQNLDQFVIDRLFDIEESMTVSTDDVILHHFYHARCKAVPEGRYVGYAGNVILWDEPLPSRKIPIREMCTSKFIGTALGYSDNWDLLSINQCIDQLCSDTLTNLSTFGRQTLVVPEGTDYDVDALANGQRVLTAPPNAGEPKAVSFAAMPEAVKWFLEYMHRRQESISQLNAVARGNPEGVSSGTMAALFHSIAIEYNNARQASLDTYRKEVVNLMLDLVRANAPDEFVIEVSGLDERPFLESFKKDATKGVRSVNVVTANPMMRSQAGRLEIWNAIKDLQPSERSAAVDLITKGIHKPLTRTDATEQQAIRLENERMGMGRPCPVLITDNPSTHVRQHKAELDAHREQLQFIRDPNATPEQKRMAERIINAFQQHIAEHMMVWLKSPPPLAMFLGFQPPPQPGGAPGEANGNGEGGGGGGEGEIPEDNTGPQTVDDLGVGLPGAAKPPPGANLQTAQGG